MSYVLILFVEKVAFDPHSLLAHSHDHNHEPLSQCNEVANPNSVGNRNDCNGKEIEMPEANVVLNIKSKKKEKRKISKKSHRKRCKSVSNEKSFQNKSLILSQDNSSNSGENPQTKKKKSKNSSSTKVSNEKNLKSNSIDLEKPAHNMDGLSKISNVNLFVLLIALSIHGIFEGIAMGLQKHKDDFIVVYIAIICHKWAESFTLGQSLSKSALNIYIIVSLIILFCLITPIGAIIGILASESDILVEAVILSLSGGKFLF
jgi:zinc transporter ZupT